MASLDGLRAAARRAPSGRRARRVSTPTTHGELRALFDHHARSRLLCATRVQRLRDERRGDQRPACSRACAADDSRARRAGGARELCPGAPVVVERNDYERSSSTATRASSCASTRGASARASRELMAVFRAGRALRGLPARRARRPRAGLRDDRAQGAGLRVRRRRCSSCRTTDLPLLTRELALHGDDPRPPLGRSSSGEPDLLARAVSRVVERHSGVAEKLDEHAR